MFVHPSVQNPSIVICELGFIFLKVEYGIHVESNRHLDEFIN